MAIFAGVVVAGCGTIRRANDAKSEFEIVHAADPDANPRTNAVAKVNLLGFTLPQYIDWAITNRPEVVSAELAVKDAYLALDQVRSDAPVINGMGDPGMPQITASGGHNQSTRAACHHDFSWHNSGHASASISLELLIYDFGRYDAEARAAIERILAAEQSYAEKSYDIFQDVTKTYFNLLESEALLEVALTNEVQYAEHLRQAEDRLQVGDARNLDLQRAKVDLAKARQATVGASNDVATASAEFLRALGVSADRGSREDVIEDKVNASEKGVFVVGASCETAQSAFEFARTNSPSMLVLRAKLRGAIHDVDYAISDLYPRITFSTSTSWSDPLWQWNWGFNAVQNIFLGFTKTKAVDRAVIAMRTVKAAVDEGEQKLSSSIVAAVVAAENASSALKTAEDTMKRSKENLDTVSEEFRVGEASRVDYTDAMADFTAARGDWVKAYFAGQKAEAALYALQGSNPEFDFPKQEESK